MPSSLGRLICEPIGVVRSATRGKSLLEHQPNPERSGGGVIELLPGRHFESAAEDLAGFTRIWLLWWFDRNHGWRPKVMPPRGRGRRSLFSTRAPYRPNPIGLTSVPLLEVRGRKLFIGPHDLLDGTPILDIKPYLPEVDSYPSERVGWIEQITAGAPHFEFHTSSKAGRQLSWLGENFHPDLPALVEESLRNDPFPHKTRRIARLGDESRLSCGPWRIFFDVQESTVTADRVESALFEPSDSPDAEIHRAFRAIDWDAGL